MKKIIALLLSALMLVGILAGGLTDHVYFNMDMGLMFWCVSMVMMQCSLLGRLSLQGRQKIALHTGTDKLQ